MSRPNPFARDAEPDVVDAVDQAPDLVMAAMPRADCPPPPATIDQLTKAAAKLGWSATRTWGSALLARRRPMDKPTNERKTYLASIRCHSVALRLQRNGHHAVVLWLLEADKGEWTVTGCGVDGDMLSATVSAKTGKRPTMGVNELRRRLGSGPA